MRAFLDFPARIFTRHVLKSMSAEADAVELTATRAQPAGPEHPALQRFAREPVLFVVDQIAGRQQRGLFAGMEAPRPYSSPLVSIVTPNWWNGDRIIRGGC